MNLKKLLALALALVMVFALAACGEDPAPAGTGDPAPAESGSGEPATTIKVAALESAYEETYPGMWQEVCDAFTAQTGIAVELTLSATSRTSSALPCRAAITPTSSTWPPAVKPA